ncbi:hypothetical protein [Sutcliffiella horikoshii]|uniref:Uncharacterized protein n=1 Tax=Sutcliffiella horikoshii TaxID=79883 RepID=A0A5D4T335_9BACI|nr:hypothetical protein [Sutcliffiella horikoshii]TYS68566.1 hypothetical protein FZC75_17905 [Sutcliffiella horikoshii]
MSLYAEFCGSVKTTGSSCKKSSKSNCEGCICNYFRDIFNCLPFNNSNGLTQFVIVLKGTSEPLDLTGASSPTLFRLVNFSDKNCCLALSYEVTLDTGATATRNFILDCSDIAGVTYVNDGDLGTGNSI